MQRELTYLKDILNSARLALRYIEDQTQTSFQGDTECQDAVIRRLVIIGEAARRAEKNGKVNFPQLPWREMVDMRNILIHEYDDVDLVIVWETVQRDLPNLISTLEPLFENVPSQEEPFT